MPLLARTPAAAVRASAARRGVVCLGPPQPQLLLLRRSRPATRLRALNTKDTSTAQRSPIESVSSEEDDPAVTSLDALSSRADRHVFTFRRWAIHRDSNERYLRHIRGMLTSVTWRNLQRPLTGVMLLSTLNCAYQQAYDLHALPPSFPQLLLSDGPLELTSFALALLLVFRTDSSYSRWTEALEVWTKVRNTSKDLVRDAVCWIKDPSLLSAIVRWTLCYAHSLKVYLREGGDIDKATAKLLLPHEHVQFVSLCKDTSSAYPQYALHVLTQAATRAGILSSREDKLLLAIATLNACIGSCEKILRYPIPLSYTRHTSRFLVIWTACLPSALWDDAGWATVPIAVIIAFLLLGIEEIGVQIEMPFITLPLKDIVRDIEKDLSAIVLSRKEVSELLDVSLSLTAADSLTNLITTDSATSSTPLPSSSSSSSYASSSANAASNSGVDLAAAHGRATAAKAQQQQLEQQQRASSSSSSQQQGFVDITNNARAFTTSLPAASTEAPESHTAASRSVTSRPSPSSDEDACPLGMPAAACDTTDRRASSSSASTQPPQGGDALASPLSMACVALDKEGFELLMKEKRVAEDLEEAQEVEARRSRSPETSGPLPESVVFDSMEELLPEEEAGQGGERGAGKAAARKQKGSKLPLPLPIASLVAGDKGRAPGGGKDSA